jgi:hypothetical protein
VSEPDDGWYAAETPLARGMVFELWRIKRRASARPFATIGLALLMTALVMYKVNGKVPAKVARVVIAVTEGNLATGRERMPTRELREYVLNVLLPNDALLALIKEKNLFPLRAKQGDVWATNELRDLVEITVFRNYFLYQYFDDDRRTARIELTVSNASASLAYDLAQRLARIILETEQTLEAADAADLSATSEAVYAHAVADMAEKEKALAVRRQEVAAMPSDTDPGQLAVVDADLRLLEAQTQVARIQLSLMAESHQRDHTQAATMAAGMGLQLEIVSERPPDTGDPGRNYRLTIIALMLFGMLLPVAAIGIAVFDPRIHEVEDVTRLGFTSLGHVPSFAGDRIGSLRARGIRRRRLASY